MNRILSVLLLIFISTTYSFSTEISPSNNGFVAALSIPTAIIEAIHPIVNRTTVNGLHSVSFNYFQHSKHTVSVQFSDPIQLDTVGYGNLITQDTSFSIFSSGSLRSFAISTIVLHPVRYSGIGTTMTLYRNVIISVQYNEPLRILTHDESYSKSLFQSLANFPFIPQNNTTQYSQVSFPYGNGNSVKLSTSNDQIYTVSCKEILRFNPRFNGKPINSIFLYHNNIEHPISIVSSDELIDENDVVYFLGKRPIGEQEWVDKQRDQYAGTEAFFLTFEDRVNTNNFTSLDQNYSATTIGDVVRIEQIYEEYKEYFPGFLRFPSPRDDLSLYPSTRTPGEAQYTALLSTFNSSNPATFEQSVSFVPSSNISDSLQIVASIIGLNDFHTFSTPQVRIEPNHKATFSSFNDTVIHEYSGQIEQLLPINLSTSNSFAGRNSFKVQSNMPESLKLFDGVTDWQAVNKFILKGFVQPIVFQSSISFTPKYSDNAQLVTLSGFNNKNVAIIDSTNKSIVVKNGVSGIQFLSSANKNHLQITVNSNEYSSTENFSITTISKDGGIEQVQFFGSINQNQFQSIVNNPSFEYVVFSGKNSTLLENSLRPLLQIQEENRSFTVVFKNQTILYSNQSEINSNLTHFLDHSDGTKFKIELKIPADSQSKYYVTDLSASSTVIVDSVTNFTLRSNTHSATYLVIAHKNFIAQAQELADFHAQTKKVKTKVLDVEQIYNEFSFGKKSPYAIRNFLQSTLELWQNAPTYIALFGDASNDPNRYMPKSIKTDFVPTFGRPSSDYWYVFSDSTSFRANFILGRIPVETSVDAQNYVDKVKQYALTPNQQWIKTSQFITGGFNQSELNFNINTSRIISEKISDEIFCGQHKSVIRDLKRNDIDYFRSQADTIVKNIDNGVLLNLYLAHGSSDIFQIAGWEVEKLRNFGKYFFLFTGACQTGNFSNSENSCRNETYVVAKDKGSIVSTGITGWGELGTESEIPKQMIANILYDKDNTWGSVFYNAKSIEGRFSTPIDNSILTKNSMYFHSLMQHTFLGDPLVSLPLSNTTDYVITDLKLNNQILSTSDSVVTLSGFIFNKGANPLFPKEQIQLFITTTSKNAIQIDTLIFTSQCSAIPFEKTIRFDKIAGDYNVVCRIQAKNSKDPLQNNVDSISFTVFNLGAIAFDPSPFWNVKTIQPQFRFFVPSFSQNIEVVATINKLSELNLNDTVEVISQSTFTHSDQFVDYKNFITWSPNIELEPNTLYELFVNVKRDSEVETLPLRVPFFSTTSVHNTVDIHLNTNSFQAISTSNSLVKKPQSYSLPFTNIPIQLFSNGKYIDSEGKVIRYRQIVVNGKSTLLNETARLLSILTMKDTDTVPSKLFEDDFYQQPSGVNAHEKLRAFLDTVDNESYIFLVVSDENFSGFLNKEPTDVRSMDSLRVLLRGFGSALIDSITQPGTSFAFIGKKGWLPGQAIEKISTGEDTIIVETTLNIKGKYGEIELPLFGPVSEFIRGESVIVNRKDLQINESFIMSENRQEFLLPSIVSNDTLRVLPIADSTKILQFVSSKIGINGTDATIEDSIVVQDVSLSFLPFTETSIVTTLGTSSVMRGDSLELIHHIDNYNFRDSNSTYQIDLSVRTESNIEVYNISQLVELLPPNKSTSVKMIIPTTNFSGNVQGISRITPINKREFFDVNNQCNFQIGTFEDTIKPQIQVFMDNKEVTGGSVVGMRPFVTVRFSDNSFLPLTPSLQRIRINTKIYTPTNSQQYRTTSYSTENGAVLEIEFLADSLQFGESIIQIFAEDGSTNRDTAYFSVFREKNTTITDVQVIPNPITTNAMLQFYYSGSELYAPCTVSIYNSLGQIVTTQKEQIQLGNNEFPLQLRDMENNSLPIGTYYFTITLDNIFVLNQPFGTFVIIR